LNSLRKEAKQEKMANQSYNALRSYLHARFQEDVYRVPLNASFSCPNRDGRIGYTGCLFCYPPSFSGSLDREMDVYEQLTLGIDQLKKKRNCKKVIAYLQEGCNTDAPLKILEPLFRKLIEPSEVVALSIGTRPDCIDEERLELLSELNQIKPIWIEYGLQSSHDVTLSRIQRGHDFATFCSAFARTRQYGIEMIIHLIYGLPGEDKAMMLETVKRVAALGPEGIKLHNLIVNSKSNLAREYEKGEVSPLTLDEYVELVIESLELLPPETVIHRLMADCPADQLVAPKWVLNKGAVLNQIKKEMVLRKTYQGSKFSSLKGDQSEIGRERASM
jgi:radical SAM protein (TIGR01212 family)